MSKAKDDIRPEYKREELGRGVRGKYFARVRRETNLVVLEDKVAKAFPNSDAVNEALLGLLNLTEQTTRIKAGPADAQRRAADLRVQASLPSVGAKPAAALEGRSPGQRQR